MQFYKFCDITMQYFCKEIVFSNHIKSLAKKINMNLSIKVLV